MRQAIKVTYPTILARKRHTKTEILSKVPLGPAELRPPPEHFREYYRLGVLRGNHEQLRKR